MNHIHGPLRTLWELNRLPFVLYNSPAIFQRLIDMVLKNMMGTECWVFLNDIIVFSVSAQEHTQRLENVLPRLNKANLQLHLGKCVIAHPRVQYLGSVLSEDGIPLLIKSRMYGDILLRKMSSTLDVFRPSFVLQKTSAKFR